MSEKVTYFKSGHKKKLITMQRYEKINRWQIIRELPPTLLPAPLHFEESHKDKTAACHWHTKVPDRKPKQKTEISKQTKGK